MYDTIKISIPYDRVDIKDITPFDIDPNKYVGRRSAVRIQTYEEKELGIYLPHIEVKYCTGKGVASHKRLQVEFSIPKLIYGNNFDETEEQDFPFVIEKLKARLHEMKIEIHQDDLEDADVWKIHCGKNIDLTGKTSSKAIINALAKINSPNKLDVSHTDYRNEGIAYRLHSDSYELCVYDKMKDLERSHIGITRAIENDNKMQYHITEALEKQGIKDILRVEYRLNRRDYIRTTLRKCDFRGIPLTFQRLFRKDIVQSLNLYIWSQRIEPGLSVCKILEDTPYTLISKMQNANLSLTEMLKVCGVYWLKDNAKGMKTLQNMTKSTSNIVKRMNETIAKLDADVSTIDDTFKYIKQVLSDNISLKIQRV